LLQSPGRSPGLCVVCGRVGTARMNRGGASPMSPGEPWPVFILSGRF